jgi:RimJ/RimL family protein N-acetyltransferase
MSANRPAIQREYPRTVHLRDGSAVTLRLMTPADADRIVAFARSLPEDDLLFLRTDITDPEAVKQWMENLQAGRTTTVIAEANGEPAGYAALVQNRVTWQRHLGEIRTQVGLRYRSQGLGRALAGEIFSIGRERGLRKIVVQMTPDQKGAIATFERLGFKPEALLQDFVVDRSARTRDLVVMTYDVTGLTEYVD